MPPLFQLEVPRSILEQPTLIGVREGCDSSTVTAIVNRHETAVPYFRQFRVSQGTLVVARLS